jgi:hypothetical protein
MNEENLHSAAKSLKAGEGVAGTGGGWRVASGEWRVASGEWRVASLKALLVVRMAP